LSAFAYSSEYNRSNWRHWIDEDGDCQNTRAEILIRTSIPEPKLDPANCVVKSGVWYDDYSGAIFTRADQLDIDHVVPIKWAYDHGAKNWSKDKKMIFANDEYNLMAVDLRLNRQKGAKGPNHWMPPNPDYRCKYLNRFNRIVSKYGLVYNDQEKQFMKDHLCACRFEDDLEEKIHVKHTI
jgi:hypothetical protein